QLGDVRLQLGVLVDPHRLDDFLLGLLAHLDLLGLGDEIELQLSSSGIADAGAEGKTEEQFSHGPRKVGRVPRSAMRDIRGCYGGNSPSRAARRTKSVAECAFS